MERFTFFWLEEPFSQWTLFDMEIDGVIYNSCEQFMMAEKARKFEDYDAEQAIMEATHPRDQKAIGRRVRAFDEDRWNAVARDIVYVGNQAKFSQNEDMKEQLIATAGTTLVEASPFDKVWGIGLAADDPLAQSRETWQGKNWLGQVLTVLRDDILAGRERTEEDFLFGLPWSLSS